MRTSTLAIACILLTTAITCTGPDRTFVDAVDGSATTSSGGPGGGSGSSSSGAAGGASSSSSSTSTSSGSTSTSSSGGGGGAGACADAKHTCVEKAPAGWIGPVALYQGPIANAAPSCDPDYPTATDYKGQLDEGSPVCDCTCDPAAGIQCTSSAQLCYPGSGIQACNIICSGTKTALPPGQCVSIPSSASTNVSISDPPPTQVGSCTAKPTKTIPVPAWTVGARACSGGTTSDVGCSAGDVCAPVGPPLYDVMCVVTPGDVMCPDAFYAKRNVFYNDFTDMRDCTACSCGGAASKCGGGVGFQHSNLGPCAPANMSFSDGAKNAGTCGSYTMGFDSGTYNPSPSGTCPPMGGQLTGMVVKNGASTICCH